MKNYDPAFSFMVFLVSMWFSDVVMAKTMKLYIYSVTFQEFPERPKFHYARKKGTQVVRGFIKKKAFFSPLFLW